MVRKNIFVFLLILGFFVITVGGVSADCTRILKKEKPDGSGLEDGENKTLKTGESVCDYYSEMNWETGKYVIRNGKYTCKDDTSWKEEKCSDRPFAKYCRNKSDTDAECIRGISCTGTFNGTSVTLWPNETKCMNNVNDGDYGKCNGSTGQIEYLGTCPIEKQCIDSREFLGIWIYSYECVDRTCVDDDSGITAIAGEKKCIGNNIYLCQWGKFYYQEACGACLDLTEEVPISAKCGDTEGGGMDFCNKIVSIGLTFEKGTAVGEKTCVDNHAIYTCTNVPNFDEPPEDCNASTEVPPKNKCFWKEDGLGWRCGTEEESTEEGSHTTSSSINVAALGDYDPVCSVNGVNGVQTSLGCIPTDAKAFAEWLLKYIFGIGGGIAFLLMSYGFILMAMSSGDEKKVQAAKETITAAVVGLLICIFGIFILRLITVNILEIPGM